MQLHSLDCTKCKYVILFPCMNQNPSISWSLLPKNNHHDVCTYICLLSFVGLELHPARRVDSVVVVVSVLGVVWCGGQVEEEVVQ